MFKNKKSSKDIALFAAKFKGKCHNCDKQGHKLAECWINNNISGERGARDKDGKEKGMKCFNRNKYAGHMAKDCPEKKETQSGEEKKETGMFVGICKEIGTSDDILDKNHLIGFVPETKEDMEQEEFCALSDGVELWLADTGSTS
jgi:hypothetical protein